MASGMESCKHGNQAPKYILREIPESQGGTARHGCVICAYEAGIKEGIARAEAAAKRKPASE
jgi:hypothetical protein